MKLGIVVSMLTWALSHSIAEMRKETASENS